MEATVKLISPKSAPGSFVLAILAHATIYGGVLAFLHMGFKSHDDQLIVTDEVAYETFAEIPVPTEVARPIAKTPDPETPEEKTEQPDNTPKELQDDKSSVAGTQTAAKPATTTGAEGTGEATATPFYKIKPKYPRAALVSGVEGWILLKIDINEKGEVENARIVGGQERNMFGDEARRAVEKWKYKPFMNAQGQSVKKTDHEVRVDFKLQDA